MTTRLSDTQRILLERAILDSGGRITSDLIKSAIPHVKGGAVSRVMTALGNQGLVAYDADGCYVTPEAGHLLFPETPCIAEHGPNGACPACAIDPDAEVDSRQRPERANDRRRAGADASASREQQAGRGNSDAAASRGRDDRADCRRDWMAAAHGSRLSGRSGQEETRVDVVVRETPWSTAGVSSRVNAQLCSLTESAPGTENFQISIG